MGLPHRGVALVVEIIDRPKQMFGAGLRRARAIIETTSGTIELPGTLWFGHHSDYTGSSNRDYVVEMHFVGAETLVRVRRIEAIDYGPTYDRVTTYLIEPGSAVELATDDPRVGALGDATCVAKIGDVFHKPSYSLSERTLDFVPIEVLVRALASPTPPAGRAASSGSSPIALLPANASPSRPALPSGSASSSWSALSSGSASPSRPAASSRSASSSRSAASSRSASPSRSAVSSRSASSSRSAASSGSASPSERGAPPPSSASAPRRPGQRPARWLGARALGLVRDNTLLGVVLLVCWVVAAHQAIEFPGNSRYALIARGLFLLTCLTWATALARARHWVRVLEEGEVHEGRITGSLVTYRHGRRNRWGVVVTLADGRKFLFQSMQTMFHPIPSGSVPVRVLGRYAVVVLAKRHYLGRLQS